MNGNEMLDRYIHEVGRSLPSPVRDDIQLELRSLVQDALEEQTAEGTPPSAKQVAAVLQEFGSPQKIAATYHPEQGLIGPNLYPAYKLWLTIALAIIAGVHLLGLLVAVFQGQTADLGAAVANSFSSFWDVAITYVGVLTLIFAGLGRLGIDKIPWLNTDQPTTWDPYQLPAVNDPNRISRFEIITGIVFSGFIILQANFFYDALGFVFVDAGSAERQIMPFFTPDFKVFIPWLTAVWAIDTFIKVMVLAQGRWNRATNGASVVTSALFLAVIFNIYTSEVIQIAPIVTWVVQIIIAIMALITLWDMVAKLYNMVLGRPLSAKTIFQSQTV